MYPYIIRIFPILKAKHNNKTGRHNLKVHQSTLEPVIKYFLAKNLPARIPSNYGQEFSKAGLMRADC